GWTMEGEAVARGQVALGWGGRGAGYPADTGGRIISLVVPVATGYDAASRGDHALQRAVCAGWVHAIGHRYPAARRPGRKSARAGTVPVALTRSPFATPVREP